MPTLISTVFAADANSYTSVASASAYLFDSRLYVTPWENASNKDREKALIWATKLLDEHFDWYGTIRTEEQLLRWPRSGLVRRDNYIIDYDIIPLDIERATADLAVELLRRDRTTEPELLGQGFRTARVGPLNVSIDKRARLDIIPAYIIAQLDYLGDVKPDPLGDGETRLVRV